MKQILGISVVPSPIHTQVTLPIISIWPQGSYWDLCAKHLSTWSLVLRRCGFTPSPDEITQLQLASFCKQNAPSPQPQLPVLLNLTDSTQIRSMSSHSRCTARRVLLLLLETLPRIASWPQHLSSKELEIKDFFLKSETKVWTEVIPFQGWGKDLFDNALFGL